MKEIKCTFGDYGYGPCSVADLANAVALTAHDHSKRILAERKEEKYGHLLRRK